MGVVRLCDNPSHGINVNCVQTRIVRPTNKRQLIQKSASSRTRTSLNEVVNTQAKYEKLGRFIYNLYYGP